MGQILIRKIDDATLDGLKQRAAREKVSTEEGARRAIAAYVQPDLNAVLARMEAIGRRIGPLPGPSSLDDLRVDRVRDDDR